jgi:hypothetical protein
LIEPEMAAEKRRAGDRELMASDAVLVALIKHSVDAPSRARRVAAAILVEVLRSDRGIQSLGGKLVTVESKEGQAVAEEMRSLIREYGLDRSASSPRR